MKELLIKTYERLFTRSQAVILFFIIVTFLFTVLVLGDYLKPVFISIVLAYLLDGIVTRLERWRCPHPIAVAIVYSLFLAATIVICVLLLPLLWQQAVSFATELPALVIKARDYMLKLPNLYPNYISSPMLAKWVGQVTEYIPSFGQLILSASLSTIPGLFTIIIYAVLVPVLIFFFLYDKKRILAWMGNLLPEKRSELSSIWHEINLQFGNYIRGRGLEILIVAVPAYMLFAIMRLDYAIMLAVATGCSVLIPYVGVTLVTIPVVLVGIMQWGFTAKLAYLIIGYTILMVVDGNIIVPFLFAETVKLHSVAIIVALLFFGGIWGLWGVFFAIPLATTVRAIVSGWPVADVSDG